MCGRYNITDDEATRALLESLGIPYCLNSRTNIAPTESVPVIIQTPKGNQIHEMRWWLTPSWATEITNRFSMFNARAETLDSSKAFRGPYRHHRGIIPASSFIEWKKTDANIKQPFLVKPETGCFALAGLWDVWEKRDNYIESCSVITTQAIPSLKWLHQRMPLILEQEDLEPWLDPATDKRMLDKIKSKCSSRAFQVYPISPDINNSRFKDPNLLHQLEDVIKIMH